MLPSEIMYLNSLCCALKLRLSHAIELKGAALCRETRCYRHVRLHGRVTHLERVSNRKNKQACSKSHCQRWKRLFEIALCLRLLIMGQDSLWLILCLSIILSPPEWEPTAELEIKFRIVLICVQICFLRSETV